MKQSGIYTFLNNSGLLEQVSEEEIVKAKRQYWNNRKKIWKIQKMKECKAFTILLNEKELNIVNSKASKQKMSNTSFIKQSALGNKAFISRTMIGEIREAVMMHTTAIEILIEENKIPDVIANKILSQSQSLEENILTILQPITGQ